MLVPNDADADAADSATRRHCRLRRPGRPRLARYNSCCLLFLLLLAALLALTIGAATAANPNDDDQDGDAAVDEDAFAAASAIAARYAGFQSDPPPASADPASPSSPTPPGHVVHLTDATYRTVTSLSPHLVMYHAPWCGHCKQLSPVLSEFTRTVARGRLHVGKVDCDAETATCKAAAVRGYPTVRFVQEPFPPVEFRGRRSVEGLQAFAERFLSPAFKTIRASEVASIAEASDVAVFYVYDPKALTSDHLTHFASVAASLRADLPVYVVPDAAGFQRLGLDSSDTATPAAAAALVITKDGGSDHTRCPARTLQDLATTAQQLALRRWIVDNKHPLAPQLDAGNSQELLGGDHLVVLAIVDGGVGGGEGSPPPSATSLAVAGLRAAARGWSRRRRADPMKVAGRNPVRFAWLDGRERGEYVRRMYGIDTPAGLPRFVVASPRDEEFYERGADGALFDVGGGGESGGAGEAEAIGEKLLANVVLVMEGKLKGKSIHGVVGGFFVKFSKVVTPFVLLVAKHPFAVAATGVVLVFLLIWWLVSESRTPTPTDDDSDDDGGKDGKGGKGAAGATRKETKQD